MRNLGIPSLVVLAQNFSWGFNHDVGRAAVIWQLDWNCGIHFQDGALSWLLAGGLGSSPHGLFNRLLSFFMAVGFPLSGLGNPRENKAETSMCFMTKPIEVTHRYLYNILIVRNASLSPHQKGGGIKLHLLSGGFPRNCGCIFYLLQSLNSLRAHPYQHGDIPSCSSFFFGSPGSWALISLAAAMLSLHTWTNEIPWRWLFQLTFITTVEAYLPMPSFHRA